MNVIQMVDDRGMKVFAYCWTCNKEYDVSRWRHGKYGVKCDDCGGFVISPSGKIRFRVEGLREE